MKKIISVLLLLTLILSILTSCDDAATPKSEKIEMPHSSTDYIGDEYTLESLTEHFRELGFTSFENIPCDPDNDNFRNNIFVIEICTGLFSEDPWEAGEKFNSTDKIKIYYNEFPLLTPDNCPDLKEVLTNPSSDYKAFAKKYDGRYVEFDAYVYSHLTYNAGLDHIIDVAGGDYNETGAPGHIVRMGDRTFDGVLNTEVKEGENVVAVGTVDFSWSEYFKQLFVECYRLHYRK